MQETDWASVFSQREKVPSAKKMEEGYAEEARRLEEALAFEQKLADEVDKYRRKRSEVAATEAVDPGELHSRLEEHARRRPERFSEYKEAIDVGRLTWTVTP